MIFSLLYTYKVIHSKKTTVDHLMRTVRASRKSIKCCAVNSRIKMIFVTPCKSISLPVLVNKN